MAALCCFAFFGILQPDSTQTSATILTRTKSHKLITVHASQHYNSQVNQIAQTYYNIGVKLEVHASHRYSRIVQGTGYAYMGGN